MDRCKKFEKENAELTKLLIDYEIRLHNAEQDILRKDNMLSALGAVVACLQEGQEKLKAENNSFFLFNAELVEKLRNVPSGASADRHEKIVNYVLRHLFGLAMEVEGKNPSWVKEVSKIEHLCKKTCNYGSLS